MGISIKEIAKLEGVSPTTVFRALHDLSRISPETKRRILARAKQLTYKTNPLGKSLRLKKSFLVGVLTPDLTTSFFPEIIQGIEGVLDRAGYSIILRTVDSDERLAESIQILRDKHVDGLVVSHDRFPLPVYQQLSKSNFPIVFISFKMRGIRGPYVLVDNVLGGYLATEHLIGRGFREVHYVSVSPSRIIENERLLGYRKALAEHRISFREDLVFSAADDETIRKMLAGAKKPAAFFAFSDMVGAKVISLAHDLGLNPFKDLAVVGFDDIPLASIIKPALTTIAQPKQQMGAAGAESLVSLMNGGRTENVVFKPQLVVRESTRARSAGAAGKGR